ncbi:acyltransferase [Actinoplanes sp. NPDC051633]|uniref:acyltransferase family protein n=1 Tax=Actinoplanes sp. NPDC051633 TaxID=3155670 RepID=UPI0034351405
MTRDRSIDALRAVAIAGVVGGHWLVTGLVVDGEGAWRQASPLTSMPGFVPVSWILQTLGLFFFAGGFAAARSARRPALRKLAVPLAVVLGGWTLVLVTATALGLPDGTRSTIIKLVVSPLWFLLPYLALGFATGPLTRAVDRAGPFSLVAPAVLVVALSDAGLVPAWAAVVAAWSIPWILGIALARRGRTVLPAAGLLIGGLTALAVLVVALDYPASAVGVPGDGRSNLSPPSLFAVALAAAQIGLFLLIRDACRIRIEMPLVASLNRAALPIYLIHQSVFVAVVAAAAAIWPQPVPGLLTAPQDPQWIIARVAWLPFLALTLAALIRVSWRTTRPQGRLKPALSGKLLDGPNDESRPTEVIAVRDSDPPSRGRAARQRL